MKRIMFVGRSEAGKTSLTQAMRGEDLHYHKTQYVNFDDIIIDTPGEYAEAKDLASALMLYSFETDVIGMLLSAIEPFSLYPPACTAVSNRECIGIVTKIDHAMADADQAERWLRLAGCKKIFRLSSKTGEGVQNLIDYLRSSEKS